ncbi:hypothetical protein THAOC_37053 [Thalassiosira oceanica]|uniref:Uncharacterized protein n=1 Tax=Thalassiosira oceanica TaxID=159749 RepID=K0QYT0_THAOC|nr:hypothetical protein THAOC_37053 [Thalassiosira oceanica]|eukprot:EJK44408.1 hypothetical protein THAOC_37053 [Thalassiosira oceanica]
MRVLAAPTRLVMSMSLRVKWVTLVSVCGLSLWNTIINAPLLPGNSNSFDHAPPVVTSVNAAADEQLHMALALSGREPGLFDEFEAALKSVLLNAPFERSLFVHVFADGDAYEVLEGVLDRTQVTSWVTRNQVEIHAYDVQHHIKSLKAQMLETFQPNFPNFTVAEGIVIHTVGTWFRLYAHRFIEYDVDNLLYIDTDCVIMANLDGVADFIEHKPSALIHWGESMTAGFMALNIRRMEEMWTIAREAPLKEIATRFKHDLNDQLVFIAINVTHPSEVNVLPIEWDMHVAARWPSRYQPFEEKTPNVGMLHFNGGSATKTAYFKPTISGAKTWMEKFEGSWGNARYYANIPWSWGRFIAMGNRRRHSPGFQLKILSHPSPLQKESKQEKWRRMRRDSREKKRLNEKANAPVHLLYATDDAAMPGLEGSVRSVLKHASERVVIHHIGTSRLEPTLPDVQFHSLTDVHEIHNLTRFTNPHLASHRSVSRLTSLANYVRFVMADMFPNVGKMMWIDADTIIRCDIVPFFRSALSTNDHTISARLIRGEHRGEAETFNAGVMVVDLDRWRARNVTAKVEEWTALNAKEKSTITVASPPTVGNRR